MEAVLLRTGSVPALDALSCASPRISSSLSFHDRRGSVGDFTKLCTQLKLSDRRSKSCNTIRRAMSESDMRSGFEASGRLGSGVGSGSFRIDEDWWTGSEAGGVVLEREGFGAGTWDGGEDKADMDVTVEVGVPGGGDGKGKGKELGGDGGGDGLGGGDANQITKLDQYYKQMLKLDPKDPLLLRNYAKFLHEEAKDTKRADEYYGRAILANPLDGEVLGLYAKFIWETQKDPDRAKCYFNQAVHASPEDCMVMGMFAEFMWEAEEDEDDEEARKINEASPILSAASMASSVVAF
uniref:TmcB/TmcC TPR repeats domain-containing protein n=1 Tax=Kalanchoe fedtschenkoi TaxID=63787 RepID=A0A7N0UW63_KALFE